MTYVLLQQHCSIVVSVLLQTQALVSHESLTSQEMCKRLSGTALHLACLINQAGFPKHSYKLLNAIVQVTAEDVYVVLNAGCRDKDIEHIQQQLKKFQVSHQHLDTWSVTLHVKCLFA